MDWSAILAAFWATFLLGMAYSYQMFKKAVVKGETLDLKKTGRTALISVVLGLVIAFLASNKGWTLEATDTWLTASGFGALIVVFVDQIIAYATGPKDATAKAKLNAELEKDIEDAIDAVSKKNNSTPKATETAPGASKPPASQPTGESGKAPPGQP